MPKTPRKTSDSDQEQGALRVATMVANIVTAMVDEPDQVKISVQQSPGRWKVVLTVAPGDVGLVFGAEYSVLNAITRLIGAASKQQGVSVWLDFDPPGRGRSPRPRR